VNVGGGSPTLIQFNLSTLPPGVLASTVQHATLSLWVYTISTAGSVTVIQVNGAWSEAAVTSTSAPATSAIQGVVPVTQAASWITLDCQNCQKRTSLLAAVRYTMFFPWPAINILRSDK
jgi:hypothetical protein